MAATPVLGKRSRRCIETEDVAAPLSPRKRRSRHAILHIHDDDAARKEVEEAQNAVQRMEVDGAPYKTSIADTRVPAHSNITKRPSQNSTTQATQDENLPPIEFRTPSIIRFKDALSSWGSNTPRQRVRLAGKPFRPLTPRSSTTPSARSGSVYTEARQLFTQSGSPGKIIGRDAEKQRLQSFISHAVQTQSGGCTYISGPPGTGKSALVQELIEGLAMTADLSISIINCVSLSTSKDVVNKLMDDLVTTAASQKQCKEILQARFVPNKKSKVGSCLVVLDEIDNLLDGDCELLYDLFEWALHKKSQLILIGIANALDLTDRFLPRLKARNLKPDLLPFLPYTAAQIATIITERLRSTLPADTTVAKDFVPFLHPLAVQLCAKKVSSQSGDLRKAFNLVRRAIDQVEHETLAKDSSAITNSPSKQPLGEIANIPTPPTPTSSSPLKAVELFSPARKTRYTPETAPRASIAHVAKLASGIFNNGTSLRLSGLNLQQKAVLCSLVAGEKKRATRDPFTTPSKCTSKVPSIKELYMQYSLLCTRNHDGLLQPLKNTEFRDVVASLETLGLVHEWMGRTTSLLTPSKTPGRAGKNVDDKQIASAVSEKEMRESLKGPGADLLLGLFSA